MTMPSTMPGRYCLIAPCRDEEAYARRTLDSVVRQTILPSLFVIVDDGSTDQTPAILAEYAARYDFIRIIRREDRGERKVGPGVIDAFYAGYNTIDPSAFDYICKLDLDLDIPPGYFEEMMRRMADNPRLATCSGKAYFPGPSNQTKGFEGELISEACGDEMSVGMIKFYRREAFEQVGGFVREVMWDGIDCHRCRMMGWVACSWDEPALRFIHLRPMGSSQHGILTGRMRHGYGQWFMGTSPAYMAASVLFRMSRRPYVIGGAAMGWGYLRSMIARRPRYGDAAFRRFLNRYQWACLLKGKRAATLATNERQKMNWQQPVNQAAPHTRAEETYT